MNRLGRGWNGDRLLPFGTCVTPAVSRERVAVPHCVTVLAWHLATHTLLPGWEGEERQSTTVYYTGYTDNT